MSRIVYTLGYSNLLKNLNYLIMCLLDSPSLTNVKNRYGLRIAEGHSTSVYLAQSKLRKFLHAQLKPTMAFDYDRRIMIDKIVDRCEDVTTINCVYEMYNTGGSEQFILLASGKIRPFFKHANQFLA